MLKLLVSIILLLLDNLYHINLLAGYQLFTSLRIVRLVTHSLAPIRLSFLHLLSIIMTLERVSEQNRTKDHLKC